MTRARTLWTVLAAAVVVVLALAFLVPRLGNDDDSSGTLPPVALEATPSACPTPSAATPDAAALIAPSFTGTALDGSAVDSDCLWADHPVVITFLTSWCGQCQQRQDALSELARTYAGQLGFVAVATQDSADALTAFATQHTIDYPVVLDDAGAIWRSYAIREPPAIAVVGRGGRLLRGWPGGKDAAELTTELRSLKLIS